MNKTPKLKSRYLGFRSRGQKLRALPFKDTENDSDVCINSGHIFKGNCKLTSESEYKHGTSAKDETLSTKENRLHKSRGMVTPVKTQKLHFSCDDESPNLKDESPDLQPNISRSFGSPEIEVSWDYSCSQAPKESAVPTSRIKQRRRQFNKALPPLLNLHPQLLPRTEMSEEERKKKIDCLKGFYEELFSNEESSSSASPSPSPSINSQDGVKDSTKTKFSNLTVTNKCDDLSKTKVETIQDLDGDEMNSLFNDSSNDIILECTQAVEDELLKYAQAAEGGSLQRVQKSDINMNSSEITVISNNQYVNTFFPNFSCGKTKLISYSSEKDDRLNSKLGLCTSKIKDSRFINNGQVKTSVYLQQNSVQNQDGVNNNRHEEKRSTNKGNGSVDGLPNCKKNEALNSENKKKKPEEIDDIHSLFDDSIDEIMVKCSQDVEDELLSQETKNSNFEGKVLSKKHSASPLIKCSKAIKTNYKQTVHVLNYNGDKSFEPSKKLNSCISKHNVVRNTAVNCCISNVSLIVPKCKSVQITSPHHTSTSQRVPETGLPVDTDITSLLNDDDAYLTLIDFSTIDTVCENEKYVAPPKTSTTRSKVYSQLEIEAKRVEALNKLRRKRVKT